MEASHFIHTFGTRQALKGARLEENIHELGRLSGEQLASQAEAPTKNGHRQYLQQLKTQELRNEGH